MQSEKTTILVEGALMIALATVLSFTRVFTLPWGGSVTLLSMLPIVLFSIRRGIKAGLGVSFRTPAEGHNIIYTSLKKHFGGTADKTGSFGTIRGSIVRPRFGLRPYRRLLHRKPRRSPPDVAFLRTPASRTSCSNRQK